MTRPLATAELEKLTDSGLRLADDAQDVRSRRVVDNAGEEIGHISNLFIDVDGRKVRMLEVRAGGFLGLGERHFLIPVNAITSVSASTVRINASRDHVLGSPAYDPRLIEAQTQHAWEPFYGYYGLSPYWGNGYLAPDFPLSLDGPLVNEEHSVHTAPDR